MSFSSSHPEVFCKEDVLKFFSKFTGKHRRPEGRTPKQVFSCEFCETFKNTFFIENLWTTASQKSSGK